MRYADCHPDRRHTAKGLCRSCYMRHYLATHPKARERARANARSHYHEKAKRPKKRIEDDPAERNQSQYEASLRRRYGDQAPSIWWQMYIEQEGRCAICKALEASERRLTLDHDHQNNKLRGLLCDRCNRGLGIFKDDPALFQRCIDYLKKAPL